MEVAQRREIDRGRISWETLAAWLLLRPHLEEALRENPRATHLDIVLSSHDLPRAVQTLFGCGRCGIIQIHWPPGKERSIRISRKDAESLLKGNVPPYNVEEVARRASFSTLFKLLFLPKKSRRNLSKNEWQKLVRDTVGLGLAWLEYSKGGKAFIKPRRKRVLRVLLFKLFGV